MRCGSSDEKCDAATGQNNPAFGQVRTGGPQRLIGCPESYWGGTCPISHIAPRAAPDRMSHSGPSNDPVRSEEALAFQHGFSATPLIALVAARLPLSPEVLESSLWLRKR